jgi:hypothetical protein
MSATTAVIVPLAVKALTNEQLLALYNRWSTKPCKKFEKRVCGEQRVAKLLSDLEMEVEAACAPPPEDGYAGGEWGAAFPQEEQEPAEPPEATVEESVPPAIEPKPTPADPTELPTEEPEPRTMRNTILAIGGLPENSDPMAWAPDLAKKLRRPVLILSVTGELLQTVEPSEAKQRAPRGDGAPRALSKASQAMLDLCSRPEGATEAELQAGTEWQTKPSWAFMTKRVSQRIGKEASHKEVDGKMRYFIS